MSNPMFRSGFLILMLSATVFFQGAASQLIFADDVKGSAGGDRVSGSGNSGPGSGSRGSPNSGNGQGIGTGGGSPSSHGSGNAYGAGGRDSEGKGKESKDPVKPITPVAANPTPAPAAAPAPADSSASAPKQQTAASKPAPTAPAGGMGSIPDMIRMARKQLSALGNTPQIAAQLKQLDEIEKLLTKQKIDPSLMPMLGMAIPGGSADPAKMKAMMENMVKPAPSAQRASSNRGAISGESLPAVAPAGAMSEPEAKKLMAALNDTAAVMNLKMPTVQASSSKRDPKDILAEATHKLDVNPKDYQAMADRAEALNELEDFAAAEAEATRALLLEPRLIRALNARAFAYNKRGQFSLALQDVDVVLGQEPDNAFGHLNRALAFDGLGRIREALLEYELAANLDEALRPLYRDAVRRHGGSGTRETAVVQTQPLPAEQPFIPRDIALVALGIFAAASLGLAFSRGGKSPPAPAARKPAPSEVEEGRILGGNYRLDGQLGEGGMGIVFEGTDMTLQRKVAIKKMRGDGEQNAEDSEMFLQEARLVAGLKHPSLIEIYAVLQENNEIFLVFEHIAGRPLDKLLAAKGRLSPAEVLHIITEAGKGIDYAHSKKVIHRDLKPGNIMITNEGGVKIMDFGIAHRSRVSATKFTTALPCGTVFYMPPEQELGTISLESDLYALGVMTYEMLTGGIPFVGPNFMEQKTKSIYAAASIKAEGVPAAVDGVLARALDSTPSQRYHSAEEFALDLKTSLAVEPLGRRPDGFQFPSHPMASA